MKDTINDAKKNITQQNNDTKLPDNISTEKNDTKEKPSDKILN